jgi:phage-related protein
VELSSTIKDQKEYMTSQAVLTRDLGEKLIDSGRKAISAGNDMQSEYRAWYEKSVQSMTKNWNKAGKQAS